MVIEPVERYMCGVAKGEVVSNISLPPQQALDALKTAKEAKIFDSFSVMFIRQVKDPILVGQIKESNDYFFIAEWDDDVSLKDIMG